MKHPITILFCLSLILLPAVTQAEFYVIGAGGRIAGTEIKSLPYTISNPGFFYLTKNLSSASGNHGITIESSDVTLDLMGFSITGPGGSGSDCGIYITGSTGTEVRNGVVNNFPSHGIYSPGATGLRIINIRAHDNDAGIYLNGSMHMIQGCVVRSNASRGIFAESASIISNNTVTDNADCGIYGGTSSKIMDNIIKFNNTYGIQAGNSTSILSNTTYDIQGTGIATAERSLIKGNTCSHNTYGITPGDNSLIVQNVAVDNYTADISECPTNTTCIFVDNNPATPTAP